MREILFRGKTKDGGAWVEGFCQPVYNQPEKSFIGWYERADQIIPTIRGVDPETVGQFTGMTDKNGKKIFEGDIVRTENYIGNVIYDDFFAKFKVIYSKFSGNWFDFEGEGGYPIFLDCEVIGNIYDNPELLEV